MDATVHIGGVGRIKSPETEGKMKGKRHLQSLVPLHMVLLMFFCMAGAGLAYGMVNEVEYSTGLSEATGVVRV
ncbi:MAG: hypothetical protein GQ467_06135, partial [Mariprofundaceae bacterium]|nr:hypothetical protein [Mariprofundaceae bacterium]